MSLRSTDFKSVDSDLTRNKSLFFQSFTDFSRVQAVCNLQVIGRFRPSVCSRCARANSKRKPIAGRAVTPGVLPPKESADCLHADVRQLCAQSRPSRRSTIGGLEPTTICARGLLLPQIKMYIRNEQRDQQDANHHHDINSTVAISNQWRTLAFPPIVVRVVNSLSPSLESPPIIYHHFL
jgi:hypothetical protein